MKYYGDLSALVADIDKVLYWLCIIKL